MMTEKQAWLYMADFYSKEHNQIKITYHSKTTNSQQTAYYYVYLWGNNWNVTDEDNFCDSVYTGCYLRIGGICSLVNCLIQQKMISRVTKDSISAKIEKTLNDRVEATNGKHTSAYLFDMTKEGHQFRVAYCTAQANEIKDTIYGLPSPSSSDTV